MGWLRLEDSGSRVWGRGLCRLARLYGAEEWWVYWVVVKMVAALDQRPGHPDQSHAFLRLKPLHLLQNPSRALSRSPHTETEPSNPTSRGLRDQALKHREQQWPEESHTPGAVALRFRGFTLQAPGSEYASWHLLVHVDVCARMLIHRKHIWTKCTCMDKHSAW